MPYSPMELAEAFLKTGELHDALDAVKQQLEEHPEDEEAHRLNIQIQMRLLSPDKLSTLLAEFDKIQALTADDWQTKSIILERSANLAEAIDAMQSARKIRPDDERLTERSLNLLLAQEDYESALALVRDQEKTWRWLEREADVLVILGDDMLATARYGLVLSQLDRYEGVMRADYLQALKIRVILARAHAYRRLGHTDTAKELYETAQTLLKDDVTIQFNLGLIADLEGQSEEAITLCKNALAKASPTLRQNMLDSLEQDTQFAGLKQALGR